MLPGCRVASLAIVSMLFASGFAGTAAAEDLGDAWVKAKRLPFEVLGAQRGEDDPTLPGLGGVAVGSGSPLFFLNHPVDEGVRSAHSSGEPTVGVNWNTGNVFFKTNLGVGRATFDDTTSPPGATWKDVTPVGNSITTLDPLLMTDPETGRTLDLQLSGEHSNAFFTIDDGETWLPTEPPTVAPSFDHQKLGVGNFHAPLGGGTPVYPNAMYYCANGVEVNQCARSDDGGLTWGAPVPIDVTQCGGVKTDGTQIGTFNGHIAVGPDGTVYVPMRNCFAQPGVEGGVMRYGLRISRDNGLTWELEVVPDSESSRSNAGVGVDAANNAYVVWSHGFPSGHPLARVLHSDGTWGPITDLGAPYGIQVTRFTEAIAGDEGRAAVSFFGTPTAGSSDDCGNAQEWHLYVSLTYDAGATWTTVDATPVDPIQRGGVGRNAPCRNLLDFNGMALDATGRVLVGWSDGCTTRACIARTGNAAMSRDALGVVARQQGGPRLFDASDPAPDQPVYVFARHGRVFAGQIAVLDGAAMGGQPAYTLDWDFDGDGAFDDATGTTVDFPTTAPGVFHVFVQATDANGATGVGDAWVLAMGAPTPDTRVRSFDFDAGAACDEEGWTHEAETGNDWHLVTFRPSSPPCAWYHGVDGARTYLTFQEANLLSPGGSGCFYMPPSADIAAVGFDLAGRSEAGFDFLNVQVRMGCDAAGAPFTTLGRFSGIHGNLGVDPPIYAPQLVTLEEVIIRGGGPFQVRLRFVADEIFEFQGFQVDDVELFINDQPPVLDPVGDRTLFTTDTLALQLTAADPDADPVFFEADGLPAGATLDRATGAVSWSPGDEQEGAYVVTFRATDGLLADSETVTLTVLNAPPVPAADGPAEADRVRPAQFTDRSTDPDGMVMAWLWDFGDGATSTAQNPSHQYTTLGTKTVTLTATDDDGASTTAEVAKVKVKNLKPKAQFGGVPAEADRVEPVQFQQQSTDEDGAVASYLWAFGDGATSTAASPSHQYTALGDFTATLTVTDDDGDSTATSQVVRVVNLLPAVGFTHSPNAPTALLPTFFDSTASDLDGTVASYLWQFGDGGTSTLPDPTHVFLNQGTYTVSLTVTDNDGGMRTASEDIFVCAPGLSADALVEGLEHVRLEFEGCVRLSQDLLSQLPMPALPPELPPGFPPPLPV